MLDVCVNTIVRNGEDFIGPVVEAVAPYVKRVVITIDDNSTDDTQHVVAKLLDRFNNIVFDIFPVRNYLTDIVRMRNRQLEISYAKWIWIVDSDEYYPQKVIESINLSEGYETHTFQCWAVWNKNRAHWASSRPRIARIFRNDGRRWKGRFGKETLIEPNDRIKHLDLRYIHFTHIKKDKWRKQFGMERVADERYLIPMPLDTIKIVEELWPK